MIRCCLHIMELNSLDGPRSQDHHRQQTMRLSNLEELTEKDIFHAKFEWCRIPSRPFKYSSHITSNRPDLLTRILEPKEPIANQLDKHKAERVLLIFSSIFQRIRKPSHIQSKKPSTTTKTSSTTMPSQPTYHFRLCGHDSHHLPKLIPSTILTNPPSPFYIDSYCKPCAKTRMQDHQNSIRTQYEPEIDFARQRYVTLMDRAIARGITDRYQEVDIATAEKGLKTQLAKRDWEIGYWEGFHDAQWGSVEREEDYL